MAEIKMDMTEYTSIMENKKLLEEALERVKKVTKRGCGLFGVGEYTRKINDVLYDDNRTKK